MASQENLQERSSKKKVVSTGEEEKRPAGVELQEPEE